MQEQLVAPVPEPTVVIHGLAPTVCFCISDRATDVFIRPMYGAIWWNVRSTATVDSEIQVRFRLDWVFPASMGILLDTLGKCSEPAPISKNTADIFHAAISLPHDTVFFTRTAPEMSLGSSASRRAANSRLSWAAAFAFEKSGLTSAPNRSTTSLDGDATK